MLRTHQYTSHFGVSVLREDVGKQVTLHGIVREEPTKGSRSQQLVLDTGTDTVLVSANAFAQVSYGDEVDVTGKIALPQPFATDSGRTFDYPQYLLAKEIEYTVSFASVKVVAHGKGNYIVSKLLSLKQTLEGGIESVIREPAAGLGEGLLLGVKALPKDIEADFRTAGIVHIVVLSGYNIMLVVIFSLALLSRVCSRRIRIFVGMGLVVLFALMVGLSATVVRASIMALLFLTAELLHRTYDIVRSLLLAAFLMVCVSPYILLYDIGFQLSFMATVGLLFIAPRLDIFAADFAGAKEYLISTVATQIAVLPLLLYYMGQVSVVSIATNLLVLPAVPLAMLVTALAGGLALCSQIVALPLAYAAELLLTYIIKVAERAAALPFATIAAPVFSAGAVVVSYVVLAGLLLWRVNRKNIPPSLVADWIIEDEDEVKAKVGA